METERLHSEISAIWHVIAGVNRKVDEHLRQLARIHAHDGRICTWLLLSNPEVALLDEYGFNYFLQSI